MNQQFSLLLILVLLLAACGGSNSSPELPTTTNPPAPAVPSIADSTSNHSFTTDHFSGSDNCSLCHDGIQDGSGNDVSIVLDWQASMMANSSRDPFWRAKVASEVMRNPDIQEEIEATCSRCHAPMAHTEAEFSSATPTMLDDGFLHPDNPLFDAAADGVSCTLCHQIEDSPTFGTAAGFSGGFSIADNSGISRQLFGPYANPLAGPMQNQVGFTPVESAHISSSELCGSCHNLETPVVDSLGNFTNQTFPEQMVYTEWENSQFAATQSCQDCHMPAASGNTIISNRPNNGLTPRPDFSQHTFVGANTYMLDILNQNSQQLNITATGFDNIITETRNLLTSAVTLSLENVAKIGNDLDFTLRLTNHTGHKFPSSYPSRRAWLYVKIISNSSGTTVFESGAIDSLGQIADLESDTNPSGYEPHYQTITSSDQVQSYESIMENIDGDLTYTLIEAAAYTKDNRLLPTGMDKTTVPATIRPQGAAYTDPDFIGGSDLVYYQISGLNPGSYTIEVSLNYQTLAFGFAQDLFEDNDDPRVALFEELNDSARLRFETVSTDSEQIDL